MKINLYKNDESCNVNEFYLAKDNWDDWGFKTVFDLFFYNENKEFDNIGSVRIAKSGMESGSTVIPDEFEKLDDTYFSLGADIVYYENLKKFSETTREFILLALNDIALNEELLIKFINEDVTSTSLLRDVSKDTIENDYRSLIYGGALLSEYNFQYNFPNTIKNKVITLPISFKVIPDKNPPTNIHVLIGSNGVGKTYVLNNMIDSLINNSKSNSKYGYFSSSLIEEEIFNNLISVSFSAFDDRDPPNERKDNKEGIKYSYIGLKRAKNEKNTSPKSTTILKMNLLKVFKLH
jgi:hypothetical protein